MKRMIDSGRKRELANDLRLQKLVNCESTGQEMVLQFNKEKKKMHEQVKRKSWANADQLLTVHSMRSNEKQRRSQVPEERNVILFNCYGDYR